MEKKLARSLISHSVGIALGFFWHKDVTMLTNKSLLLANELNDLQPEAAGMMDVTLVTDFFFFSD